MKTIEQRIADAEAELAALKAEIAHRSKNNTRLIFWIQLATLWHVPDGWKRVPTAFVDSFRTIAHNYSLEAVAPDYYRGAERDAFANAYRRCGRELAALQGILDAAPEAPAGQERCEYCDGTGDVHGLDGEWRGVCSCPAGEILRAPAQHLDMVKDAERYRQVRRGQHWSVIDGIGDVLRGDGLDAKVDAIIAAEKGGE